MDFWALPPEGRFVFNLRYLGFQSTHRCGRGVVRKEILLRVLWYQSDENPCENGKNIAESRFLSSPKWVVSLLMAIFWRSEYIHEYWRYLSKTCYREIWRALFWYILDLGSSCSWQTGASLKIWGHVAFFWGFGPLKILISRIFGIFLGSASILTRRICSWNSNRLSRLRLSLDD